MIFKTTILFLGVFPRNWETMPQKEPTCKKKCLRMLFEPQELFTVERLDSLEETRPFCPYLSEFTDWTPDKCKLCDEPCHGYCPKKQKTTP